MKISKKDALTWFRFFAALPEDEELLAKQTEIVYAAMYQIEAAVDARNDALAAKIPGLKSDRRRAFPAGASRAFWARG